MLADRAGYVFWSLHILLPLLGETHLRRRDLESARRVGRRMREEGARIGHKLATAWADACDAIVHWLSGDVEKSIDPASLEIVVPSMLLQPLVENSIKHGPSPKIGEGQITIRSVREKDHVIIDVIDNGVGVGSVHAERVQAGGIGLRNVNERLKVIYGANYQLQLDSVPGQGTCARIVIPELVVPARMTA